MNNAERKIEQLEEQVRSRERVIAVLSKDHIIPFTMKPFWRETEGTILGDIMTIGEFEATVNSGGFIDYDGYGYFCTTEMQSDIKVSPSMYRFLKPCISKELTHVIWFNR